MNHANGLDALEQHRIETLAVAARHKLNPATENAPAGPNPFTLNLKPGEWVEVRSATEIKATLNVTGKLDGLPFMPEMLRFCGHRYRVFKRAGSTCYRGQPRRMESTVHLDQLRCDGSAHQGCRASCLLLWKEAWLRRVSADNESMNTESPPADLNALLSASITGGAMMCQATEIGNASCEMLLARPPQYLIAIPRALFRGELDFQQLRHLYRYFRGKLILWLFIRWARAPWNASHYTKTPSEKLDLRPGELVRVRSRREILRTLDRHGRNKGMDFKPEMFQFCGCRFRVLSRMTHRIDEHTSEMREFRNECIILDGVFCDGQRSFCARGNYHYWREIWLRRC